MKIFKSLLILFFAMLILQGCKYVVGPFELADKICRCYEISNYDLESCLEENQLYYVGANMWDENEMTQFNTEEMPSFPGGEMALFKYLGSNIKYPKEARDKGIQGIVYARFVVNEDGTISDVEVFRGIGGGCDEETIRVIEAMPNWKPGKQRGNFVKVKYQLPIRFTSR